MCGICGVFDQKNEYRVNREAVLAMTEKLVHRGPDAMDCYVGENVALGFTRLSIVDLENGMQPLVSEDGSVILVCNGEIYNYKELRSDLVVKGHRFRTYCDVEVIVHLYEEHGVEFLNLLNGQFAFALFDSKNKSLLCARDYAGIAPFFYTVAEGLFIFGSEIKSILAHQAVQRECDLVGLDQILTFPGLISPRTLFKGINSLEPGHYLMIRQDKMVHQQYWDLIYEGTEGDLTRKDESYYAEKLDYLLKKSVNYRLQADVPVGFYVSGGLDSCLIAALIKELDKGSKRHSFSIDFTQKEISESKYQRLMAKNVDSIHHERLFQFNDIIDRLPEVIYHSECALKETYNTASLALSHSVREQGIKVVLTGEGADELFGGYIGYRFDRMKEMRKGGEPIGLDPESSLRKAIWGDGKFLYEKEYFSFGETKQKLYSKGVNDRFDTINCLNYPVVNKEHIKNTNAFQRRSYVDFKLRMADHLLSDHGDRMSYANSVEARYPFLDKEFIEFVKTIPVHLKLKDFTEKYLLKVIARDRVPEEIVKRPKFAFTAPGSPELLQQDQGYIHDILSYDRIKRQGFFNPDTVEDLKKRYSQEGFKLNVPYENDLLITVITLGIFLEVFKVPGL